MLTFIPYIEVYFTFPFLDGVRYNDDFVKSSFVTSRFLFLTFYCNFGRAEENRSLYRGLFIEVRYIEVPLYEVSQLC